MGTRFGKYELLSMLGRGGMGEVYEARDTEKRRVVALKILVNDFSKDSAFRSRFQREAHAAAQLQEPHVIPIHDWGEIDGLLYIDMRLVRGTDLRKLLSKGPFPPQRAVHVVEQVAAALDAAHADGLIHRDVKPENIVITTDDFAYLLDFGIAERTGDPHLTQAGMTVGSLAYIAPERLSGDPTSAVADVYSLTCVLYEALCGGSPFETQSMQHLIAAHLHSSPPPPSTARLGVPATFDAVIERGMAKEPDERYGSAGALARAARRALATTPSPAVPPNAYATMPGPQVLAATEVHTQVAQRPSQREPAFSPSVAEGQHGQTPRWLLPAGIAAVAALLLTAGGLAIGVMVGQRGGSDPAPVAAEPSLTRMPVPDPPSIATTPERAPGPRSAALPPMVDGVDANSQRCDGGITHPGASGAGSRSARGTVETSCLFARNVLYAYWDAGPPSATPRTVYAPGSVPCPTTGGRCSGDRFIMQCGMYGSDNWITCTGGSNARVYIF